MHAFNLVLFPLLGLSAYLLLGGMRGVAASAGRVAIAVRSPGLSRCSRRGRGIVFLLQGWARGALFFAPDGVTVTIAWWTITGMLCFLGAAVVLQGRRSPRVAPSAGAVRSAA